MGQLLWDSYQITIKPVYHSSTKNIINTSESKISKSLNCVYNWCITNLYISPAKIFHPEHFGETQQEIQWFFKGTDPAPVLMPGLLPIGDHPGWYYLTEKIDPIKVKFSFKWIYMYIYIHNNIYKYVYIQYIYISYYYWIDHTLIP